MSKVEKFSSDLASGPEAPSVSIAETMDLVANFLRRGWLTIVICVLLSLVAGAVFLRVASPIYTASSTMMIETQKTPFQDSLLNKTTQDAPWSESQIGVLRSQPVAAYVVRQLRPADDPQFIRSDIGPFDKLLARLGWGSPEPQTEAERAGAAVAVVMGGLDVKRSGQSYVLLISFRSPNADVATKVANTIIDGYIFDQLNAKYQANRRAGDWLQERLQALREQAATAERAALEFKAKNNIVPAGGGTLMNEKQVADVSGQLAAARARTSDLQVRLERVQAVREAYQQDQPTQHRKK